MKKLYLFLILFTGIINAQEPFITTWQVETNLTINSPVYGTDNNYTIDFGDGTVLTNQTESIAHTYGSVGTYTVTLSGNFNRIQIVPEDVLKIRSVEQWGDIQWISMEGAFAGCRGLILNANDTPDLSQVTNMSQMFSNCDSLNQSVNNWDVSNVTDMSYMFSSNSPFSDSFNQPLNNWNVSNVVNMQGMFHGTHAFNQPLNDWDVSNVTNMHGMFQEALAFDQPLNNWDVSNVTDISFIFDSSVFNQPIDNWDISGTTSLLGMFWHNHYFNQPLNNLDVSNITDMSYMFNDTYFNQPIEEWDVSNVVNMSGMFFGSLAFNQPLNNWDVSNVTNMLSMFGGCEAFNQPLNNWDVSNVTNMGSMFFQNHIFNQPLNDWDISGVTNINAMFDGATSFNQPLNNWDVSNITEMHMMFTGASAFNQDISAWNFNPDVNLGGSNDFITATFVGNTNMDTDNYDALLLKFAQLGLENKTLKCTTLSYCNIGVRNYLIDELGWTIEGDTIGEECVGNNITGTVIYDENANGCDTEDPQTGNFLVRANNGEYNYSVISSNGEYDLRVIDGTYNIELLNVPGYYTVTPPSSEVSFTGFGNEEELNFCLTANEAVSDLNITLLPLGEARPGFESHYRLVADNIGTQTITGTVASLTYNETIQSFVSASQAPASTTANQLNFDLGTILPLEIKTIDITMQTFTPPTINGGETINFIATITPDSNDFTPDDNTFSYDQIVVNSFDPNDKTVLQGDEIYMEQTEGYLDYIIRFQNTGSASAITVRIEDLLHENLDWNTFKIVSASHAYHAKITDGNQVEFIFNNINLPHEGANEAGSHGFIAYKIKPVANIQIGDMITGTAGIFFDYNLPIITNSADTEVVEPPLGVSEYTSHKVSLYPNPASSVLHLQAGKGITIENIKVYNLQGSEVLSFEGHQEAINIQDLSSGLYLVSILTDKGLSKYRLIKK